MKLRRILCLFLMCMMLCACTAEKNPTTVENDVIITLEQSECKLVSGETFQVKYTTSVENAHVVFSSSDVKVATVDANGLITAIGKGSAVISVSAGDYSKAYVNVEVAPETMTALPSVLLNNSSLELIAGTQYTLSASVKLGTTTLDGSALTWQSADPSVVEVKDGELSARKAGETTVTVSAEVDGVKTQATCTIIVYDYYRIVLDQEAVNTSVGSTFTLTARIYDAQGNEIQPKVGELVPISSNENSIQVVGNAFKVVSLGSPSVGFRYKGNVASIPVEIYGINAEFFSGSVKDYYGTVDGQTFSGLIFESANYQPHVYFSDYGVEQIKAYAAENGYTTLRIHAIAYVTNNALVLNNTKWINASWDYFDLSVSDITTKFDFWSQSEGSTECYLWFEFR